MTARADRAALAATLALLLGGAGCGGSANQTSAPTETATPAAPASGEHHPGARHPAHGGQPAQSGQPPARPGPPASAFHPKPHHDSGGGSQQFIVTGGDNSAQEFGAEASASEFDQAAAALHGFLDARAERNWAAACTYLSAATKWSFAQPSSAQPEQGCPTELAALSGKVPTATLREAALADVGNLRAQGERGFLIYRGAPEGTIYAIFLMSREAGAWKVASLPGTPLN